MLLKKQETMRPEAIRSIPFQDTIKWGSTCAIGAESRSSGILRAALTTRSSPMMILVRLEASMTVLQNSSKRAPGPGRASAPISKLTTANYYAWQLIWSLSPAISSWAYRDAAWVSPDLPGGSFSWGQEPKRV